MDKTTLVNKSVLAIVVAAISALFLGIIWRFLEAIFLAGLFAAVFHPLYRKILRLFGNSRGVASLFTLLIVLCFVFIPIVMIGTVFVGQGVELASNSLPWFQNAVNQPGFMSSQLEKLPFYSVVEPYRDQLAERLGGVFVLASSTVVDLLQSATRGTVNTVITALLVFYSFFFFLMDGDKLIKHILYYLPLDDKNEGLLLNRFRSVTIATLKGTAVIGFLQGTLAGIGLWVCNIPNALFLSVAMMLLSVVPGIGAALVWIPACIYLAVNGQWVFAIGLFVYCALLVGSIDNVLRPKLVGSDTQLHELMIFFSTLGGLLTFGLPGFIIGPIIAALFVTVWEIYGVEFSDWLPKTNFIPHSEKIKNREEIGKHQKTQSSDDEQIADESTSKMSDKDTSYDSSDSSENQHLEDSQTKNTLAENLNYPSADSPSSGRDNNAV